jgi:hypothetical protein
MKKWMFLLLMILLTGCGAQETFETVADELVLPAIAQPRFVCVDLPGETAMPVIENDHGRIYVCNDYEILLQTVESGNLEETVRMISGLSEKDITMLETGSEDVRRYEFVWASAGEGGDRSGRAVILDDGNYHYCLSVLRDTDQEKTQVNWDQVFSSFQLA